MVVSSCNRHIGSWGYVRGCVKVVVSIEKIVVAVSRVVDISLVVTDSLD